MSIAIPTELKTILTRNNKARSLFYRMPSKLKQEFTSWIIDGTTRRQRDCRARTTVDVLLGRRQNNVFSTCS